MDGGSVVDADTDLVVPYNHVRCQVDGDTKFPALPKKYHTVCRFIKQINRAK